MSGYQTELKQPKSQFPPTQGQSADYETFITEEEEKTKSVTIYPQP